MHFSAAIRKWQFPDLVSESKNLSRLEIIADSLNVALHHLASLSGSYSVLSLIQGRLAQEREIGSSVRVYFFLQDFLSTRSALFQRAVRDAETTLRPMTNRRGQRSYAWYDFFVEGVLLICERNGIKPTISTNRSNWKRGGRFLEIAERIEQVLPVGMRSPNRQALAQRLKRSRGKNQRRSASALREGLKRSRLISELINLSSVVPGTSQDRS